MGARRIGDIAALTGLVPPDIAVVLNVGQAHLGKFGSRAAIARAKGELVEGLALGGTAVLNADDPRVAAMRPLTDGPVLTFGLAEHADVRVTGLTLDRLARPSFTLQTAGASATVTLPLTGAHQAVNASAAVAAGLAAGVPLDVAAAALATASLSKWRLELRELAVGATLLNDSFNANPDSARTARTRWQRLRDGAASPFSARCSSSETTARPNTAPSGSMPLPAPTWWPRSARPPDRSPTARDRGR